MIEEGTADEVRQLVGESYMLRAYVHFLLVNLYGEPYTHCDPATSKAIPLKLNSDTEAVLTRNTVGEVYSSILSDSHPHFHICCKIRTQNTPAKKLSVSML